MDGHIAKPILEPALWSALERVLPPRAPAPALHGGPHAAALPPVPRPPADFSPWALESLASSLPHATVHALAQRFMHDLQQRLEHLGRCSSAGDLPQQHHLAHQIAGTAETFGLERLGILAAALVRTHAPGDAASTVEAMRSAAHSGMGQLQEALAGLKPRAA